MKNFTAFLLLLIPLTLSCNNDEISSEKEKGLLKKQTITVGGIDRNYHLYVPNKPLNAPVVFLFHGNGGSYDDMLGFTGVKAPYKVWLDIANQENLIVVVPNGTMGGNNKRGWNDCRNLDSNPDSDDVLFISELIGLIIHQYEADASRIYVNGTSNGGHIAFRLAQEIPGKITAFAAVAASKAAESACVESDAAISALFMNGTGDPIMPYDGGEMALDRGSMLSTEASVTYWVNRNQADTEPEITKFPDTDPDDQSTVTRYIYRNGQNNTEVALYKVVGGGHVEPGISERYGSIWLSIVGHQNGDIEMANEVWDFFKTKTKERKNPAANKYNQPTG